MSGDEFDAIGSIAAGGLVAGSLEPDHGGPGGEKPPEQHATVTSRLGTGTCANCDTPLHGNYCSNCGQKAGLHRTLTAFWHDFLHGALHFDGKIWRTLPLLVLKPGELTRRYVEGERARFVSPMALFLFAVFLMFAVFQAIGLTAPTQIRTQDGMRADLEQVAEQRTQRRDALAERLSATDLTEQERARLEEQLLDASEEVDAIDRATDLIVDGSETSSITANLTGIESIDSGIFKKWRENPSLMVYKLQANSYKFSWLLIPLSVPFVWLLFFWKRRFKAYDHAIFVTYSLSFMTLLFIALSVIGAAGVAPGWLVMAGLLIPLVHMYKQLRGTYALGRFSAAWRLAALIVFITIVTGLFLQLLLILGAF